MKIMILLLGLLLLIFVVMFNMEMFDMNTWQLSQQELDAPAGLHPQNDGAVFFQTVIDKKLVVATCGQPIDGFAGCDYNVWETR